MFDPGSAKLKYYAEDILYALAPILSSVPNKITITGHTDSSGNRNAWNKGNWELSAGRANSARRALSDAGLPADKIAQVVGMGDTAHFDTKNPKAAVNRRIAIIVMNKTAQKAVESRTGGYEDVDKKKIQFKAEGTATQDTKRDEALDTTQSTLEQLKKERERENNTYDNPPNQEEIFW
jgi:chemotaxis protein MotB